MVKLPLSEYKITFIRLKSNMDVFVNILKIVPSHLNIPNVFATRPAMTWLSHLVQSAQLLEMVPVRWDVSVQKEWS